MKRNTRGDLDDQSGELAEDLPGDLGGVELGKDMGGLAEVFPVGVVPLGFGKGVGVEVGEGGAEGLGDGVVEGLGFFRGDAVLGDEFLGVLGENGGVVFDGAVHEGLGEHGFVGLVVAEAAVAHEVDDDGFFELFTEICGQAKHPGNVLWAIPVHVQHRTPKHTPEIGAIRGGA